MAQRSYARIINQALGASPGHKQNTIMAKKTINAIIHALENRAEKLYANAHSQRAYMAGVRDAMNELNINTSNI